MERVTSSQQRLLIKIKKNKFFVRLLPPKNTIKYYTDFCFIMKDNINILLGAGFSRPAGYPLASNLNDFFKGLNGNHFSINSSDGDVNLEDEISYKWCSSDYYRDMIKTSLLSIIKQFVSRDDFNYEDLYDNIDSCNENNIEGEIGKISKIFTNLVVKNIIEQKSRRQFYTFENPPNCIEQYRGFINLVNNLNDQYISTNVFSLNHDMLLEGFDKCESFKNELFDGFTSENSNLFYNQERKLSYFDINTVFNSKINFFKLHGSLDFYKFSTGEGKIIVRAEDVKSTADFQLKTTDSKFHPEVFNFSPEILIGTSAKISKYGSNKYYDRVFKEFQEKLDDSNKLLIIGYGFGDSKINEFILERYNKGTLDIYVLDPSPKSDKISGLFSKTEKNRIHILSESISVESIKISDIN